MELIVAGLSVLVVTMSVLGLVGSLPDDRLVKRELAHVRPEPIDSLADGSAVTVRGTVTVLDNVIAAPLTGRRCVYWGVVFDEVGAGGDFRELGRAESGTSFLLVADTGTARIVPDRPRTALHATTLFRTTGIFDPALRDPVSELARKICKRPNHPTSFIRATEYAIEPDATITVRGWCTREPLPDATSDVSGYREELPTRPVISGSRRTRMMIA